MIYKLFKKNKYKKFALLIDPDKHNDNSIVELCMEINKSYVDIILVGGSLIHKSVDYFISVIKKHTKIPVVLFPGGILQISNMADAILLLSLISGRNPDFLIGKHVVAAPFLKKSKLEIISTGYILIESGRTTSVEYISNTKPIPANKPEIAVATAIAGEMLGNRLIYLEGGSGADSIVRLNIIRKIKKYISVPLIVGGGIKTKKQINEICKAGADILVVGTAVEKNIKNLKKLASALNDFNT